VSPPAVTPTTLVRPSAVGAPLAAFTVDVEDWYQSCIDYDAPITERVVRNTEALLQMLEEWGGVKGTFFVQGLVAETFPRLVETLVANGHEVQSHGHSHRPLYAMNRRTLRNELERARKAVEDASGQQVTAFRAQDFSIVNDNLWALGVLAECGFEVDSSIFPMRAGRYGIAGWELAPHRVLVDGGPEIVEVPVAVWSKGAWRLPVAGGGYFRLFPDTLIRRALRAIAESGRPPIVYCHPYEFNPDELSDYAGRAPRRTLVSQGIGRSGTAQRFRDLLAALPFGRFDSVLSSWGVT
jgi:polysaccharide deacetylase family protein (PEP-CTERM system associated)